MRSLPAALRWYRRHDRADFDVVLDEVPTPAGIVTVNVASAP
jgi:hypothetical protein